MMVVVQRSGVFSKAGCAHAYRHDILWKPLATTFFHLYSIYKNIIMFSSFGTSIVVLFWLLLFSENFALILVKLVLIWASFASTWLAIR